MKKINITIVAFTALMALAGCTSGYENVNRDPATVTGSEQQRNAYALQSSLVQMEGNAIPSDFNGAFQYTELLLGGSFGGYTAPAHVGTAWPASYATYNPGLNTSWATAPFGDIITKVFPAYFSIRQVTTDPIPLAVSDIIKVFTMSRITDIYGPIPYSKLGMDGAIAVPFDSQKDVYTLMFAQLDSAITTIKTYSTSAFKANADRVYGGNPVPWGKFANSLKLRLAMRLANVDPATAQKEAEAAVADPVGLMTANSDNALFDMGTVENPYHGVMVGWGDDVASADITSYMNGYNDPRRAAYFTKASNGNYLGFRSGQFPIPTNSHSYSSMNVAANSKLMWMNAAEVAFLRAEGALRGWNMGGSAESFYNQGITLSFDQWGVAGAGTYLANTTYKPASYTDALGSNTYSGTPSTITIAWDATASTTTNLERIITQKWIANYPSGLEAWAEYRRTGYPKLMPVVNNLSGGVVSSIKMARRMPYPQEEYTNNKTNVTNAVTLLGGPDNMATNVWWDTSK